MEAKQRVKIRHRIVHRFRMHSRFAALLLLILLRWETQAVERIDPAFATKVGKGTDGFISDIVVDDQRRIIIAGTFTEFNGAPVRGLARLHPDGTLDSTFVPGLTPDQGVPQHLALHRDGYILTTADSLQIDHTRAPAVFRIRTDGSSDPAFTIARVQFSAGAITKVVVDKQSRILVAGLFSLADSVSKESLVRLSETGARDTSFQSPSSQMINSLSLLSDGRIVLVAGDAEDGIQRLQADGIREWPLSVIRTRENFPGPLIPLPDGRLLIPNLYRSGTRSDFGLVRVGPRLEPDLTLDTRDWLRGFSELGDMVQAARGEIYALHTKGLYSPLELLRLRQDGTLDQNFAPLPLEARSLFLTSPHLLLDGDSHVLIAAPRLDGRWILSRILVSPSPDTAPSFLSEPSINVPLWEPGQNVLPGHLPQASRLDLVGDVLGDPQPDFQWQRDGTNLPGATNPVLTIAPLSTADAGNYRLIATNRWGALTSRIATVLIDPRRPALLEPVRIPAVLPGSPVRLEAAIAGEPPVGVYWVSPNEPAVLLGTGPVLTLRDAPPSYRLIVSNAFGSLDTGPLSVTAQQSPYQLPPSLMQPSEVYQGDHVTVTASEQRFLSPATFWWLRGTNVIPNTAGSLPPSLLLSNVQGLGDLDLRLVRSNALAVQTSAPLATLLITNPPSVLTSETYVLLSPHRSESIPGTATGGPEALAEWWRDGVRVGVPRPLSAGAPWLEFPWVTSADQGLYSLIVRDRTGSVTSAPVRVVVRHPPTIVLEPTGQVVTAGMTLRLTSSVEAAPAAAISWFRTKSPSGPPDAQVGDGEIFTLPSITPFDDGFYYFIAGNSEGTARSQPVRVEVKYAPIFTVQPPPLVSTNTGLPLRIPTEFMANPSATVQWYHAGIPVAGQTQPELNLFDPQPSDSGKYWAVAANELGTNRSQTVSVSITDLRPKILVNPTSLGLSEGAELNLSCAVTGHPLPSLQWFFNNQPILGADSSRLILANTKLSQAGAYILVASNRAGLATSVVANITVKAASTRPGAVEPSFRADLNTNGVITSLVPVGPDTILVGGNFTSVAGVAVTNLALLHRDGSVDPMRFNPTPSSVTDVAARADGRILVNTGHLQVYLPSGEIDPSFSLSPGSSVYGHVAWLEDGKILCDSFRNPSNPSGGRRLLADGSQDPNMAQVSDIPSFFHVLHDRNLMLQSVGGRLTRFAADGGVDLEWSRAYSAAGGPTSVLPIAILENRVVLGVSTGTLYGFRPDGSLAFRRPSVSGDIYGALELSDGRVLSYGAFRTYGCCPSRSGYGLALLDASQTQEDEFELSTVAGTVFTAGAFGDGSILIGGRFERVNDLPRRGLALLRPGETVAPILMEPPLTKRSLGFGDALQMEPILTAGYPVSFQWLKNGTPIPGARRRVYAVDAVRGTDAGEYSLVVSNSVGVITGFQASVTVARPLLTWTNAVALNQERLEADGPVHGILPLTDGSTLIYGRFLAVSGHSTPGMARLTPDGRVDRTFTSTLGALRPRDGAIDVRTALRLSDGSILVGGPVEASRGWTGPLLRRLTPAGESYPGFSLPNGFPTSGSPWVFSLVQDYLDGTVWVGLNENLSGSVFRLKQNGESSGQEAIKLQTGGVISVRLRASRRGGVFLVGRESGQGILLHIDAKGGVTPLLQHAQSTGLEVYPGGPSQGGSSGPGATASDVLELSDGSLLVSGAFIPPDGSGRNLAVIRPNGSLDSARAFAIRATGGPVFVMQPLATGEILIAGRFTSVGGLPRSGLALLSSDASSVLDSDPGTGPAQAATPYIYAVAENSYGQLWFGGLFGKFNGRAAGNIALLMGNMKMQTVGASTSPPNIRTWGWEGYQYSTERASELPAGPWKTLKLSDGANGPLEFPADTSGFYRVRAE